MKRGHYKPKLKNETALKGYLQKQTNERNERQHTGSRSKRLGNRI